MGEKGMYPLPPPPPTTTLVILLVVVSDCHFPPCFVYFYRQAEWMPPYGLRGNV